MNPDNDNQYRFDNEWLNLDVEKAKLKVRGIPVTIKKAIYWSKVWVQQLKRKKEFRIRIPAMTDIRAMEEWYRMNKAKKLYGVIQGH
jgi:acyl-homoserine lactone acylase PvdQ